MPKALDSEKIQPEPLFGINITPGANGADKNSKLLKSVIIRE